MREAVFAEIETTGDGSVGIRISIPLGTLHVTGDVAVSGGEGLSLVKGVQVPLKAIALSIKPGGDVERIEIGGRLATSGDNVVTLEIEGALSTLGVAGGIHATGRGSDAAHVTAAAPDLTNIEMTAAHGEELVRT